MKVRIHRGSHEIGGSCVEVEEGSRRLLIDAGLPLDIDPQTTPKLPQVDFSSLEAVVISHPHLDHYGLLAWLPRVSVAIGPAARRILTAAAPFMKAAHYSDPLEGPDLVNRQSLQLGPFKITPYLVDHSAYEAFALLVEANGKRLFYSGDFRIHGRKRSLVRRLMADPPPGLDALLLEGSTLGRSVNGSVLNSEDTVEQEFVSIFRATRGLALVHTSPQNIDRLVTLYRACRKSNRTLVIDLYAAAILEATGNPRIPQSHWDGVAVCIPQWQRIQIKEKGMFNLLDRHSSHRIYPDEIARHPDAFVLLFRGLWMNDLDGNSCLQGACLIHSQWEGYLSRPGFLEIDAWRNRHNLPFHLVHTSGHASADDLKRFAAALAPEKVVPIHTTRPEEFDRICSHVARHADGEWWEV